MIETWSNMSLFFNEFNSGLYIYAFAKNIMSFSKYYYSQYSKSVFTHFFLTKKPKNYTMLHGNSHYLMIKLG